MAKGKGRKKFYWFDLFRTLEVPQKKETGSSILQRKDTCPSPAFTDVYFTFKSSISRIRSESGGTMSATPLLP
jgi:hypothetical protein